MVDNTLTELCQELNNWFDRARYIGTITLEAGGDVYCNGVKIGLLNGQYYRVMGSLFADGIHIFPDAETTPEAFDGAVWAMAVPPTVMELAEKIAAWREKYEAPDSSAMSPYSSESFGGYSYSKGTVNAAEGGGRSSWKSIFAPNLNPWRKLR